MNKLNDIISIDLHIHSTFSAYKIMDMSKIQISRILMYYYKN